MNTLHPKKEELFDYYTKTITGRFALDIAAHMKECDNCKNLVTDFEKIETAYQNSEKPIPSQETLAFIQNYAKKKLRFSFAPFFMQRRLGLVFSLVLIAGLGLIYRGTLLSNFNKPKAEEGTSLKMADTNMAEKQEALPVMAGASPETVLPEAQPPAPPQTTASAPKEIVAKKVDTDDIQMGTLQNERKAAKKKMGIDMQWAATMQIATSLEKAYKYEEAEKLFGLVAKGAEPNSQLKAIAMFHLAYCQKQLSKNDEALKTLNSLKGTAPDYPGLDEAIKELN